MWNIYIKSIVLHCSICVSNHFALINCKLSNYPTQYTTQAVSAVTQSSSGSDQRYLNSHIQLGPLNMRRTKSHQLQTCRKFDSWNCNSQLQLCPIWYGDRSVEIMAVVATQTKITSSPNLTCPNLSLLPTAVKIIAHGVARLLSGHSWYSDNRNVALNFVIKPWKIIKNLSA